MQFQQYDDENDDEPIAAIIKRQHLMKHSDTPNNVQYK